MLPVIHGEFGVVADPEVKFSEKGNAWLRLRLIAKDRVRDTNGQWVDGKPLFLDAWIAGKMAENLTDSVSKGDSIIVSGKLEMNEWEDNTGTKRTSYRILVDQVGVSLRWSSTKQVTREQAVARVTEAFEAQPEQPPF